MIIKRDVLPIDYTLPKAMQRPLVQHVLSGNDALLRVSKWGHLTFCHRREALFVLRLPQNNVWEDIFAVEVFNVEFGENLIGWETLHCFNLFKTSVLALCAKSINWMMVGKFHSYIIISVSLLCTIPYLKFLITKWMQLQMEIFPHSINVVFINSKTNYSDMPFIFLYVKERNRQR